jgi:hypothetical protein
MPYRALADTERDELRVRDDAALPRRDRRDLVIRARRVSSPFHISG